MTITTLDAALARKLEPYAPRPDLRLEAVKALAQAGIETGVAISPVMPRITDSLENLDALAAGAAKAGAKYLWAQPLFLKECAQKVFFPWLAREFPALESKYRAQFRGAAYLKGPYVEFVKQRANTVRAKYGLGSRGSEYVPAQMSLFIA
jgi:DNA repair photolyase